MENPEILIYTDGSSRGNPGPGGYGIIIQQFSDKRSKEFSKGFRKTTNNRMELLAVIETKKTYSKKFESSYIYRFKIRSRCSGEKMGFQMEENKI